VLKIIHILIAILFILASATSSADMDTSTELVEEEFLDEFAFLEDAGMVELAARHKQEIGMSPSAVTVLTREDIEASGATNLPDLLRLVPGMDVQVASTSFYAVTSRLYWSDENIHYLVLVDGRDAVTEVLGQVAWGVQPVSLDDVERIEIVRGPASSLYGANALTGVISITTRAVPEKTSAFARLSGGEVGMAELSALASTRIGDWGFSLSGGLDRAGSFNDPRLGAKDCWKVRALAQYRWSESERLRIDAGISEGSGLVAASAGSMDMTLGLRFLRLSYESKDLQGQIYWHQTPATWHIREALELGGIRLATFKPVTMDNHTGSGEVQWTVPEFWEPLLLIVGGGGLFSWSTSDNLLDRETYADITSSDYRQPGISHLEGRAGAFVHAEVTPIDWVTVTGSLRFDYNTVTDPFLSPRLAAVFKPAGGQFLRMGVARAFRKPSFVETHLHPMAEFPDDSPITGTGRQNFQEFMSRMIGNPDLRNETLTSFDAGYLGQFLNGQLSVALDLYVNLLRDVIELDAKIAPTAQGLPDLVQSHIYMDNKTERDLNVFGGELSVRYSPSKQISLLACWSHREIYLNRTTEFENRSPKNLFTLGGRLRTDWGLLGSLYLFTRSDFRANTPNPDGLMEPAVWLRSDNVMLVLCKLGWKWTSADGFGMEAGAKLFLPVSPFAAPHFRYHEKLGGMTADGRPYGGDLLRRMVTVYLQGSF